jgi:hypothetical protein
MDAEVVVTAFSTSNPALLSLADDSKKRVRLAAVMLLVSQNF